MASTWFTEHAHQKWLFEWAHAQSKTIPELRLMFAVPNGGWRHPAVAGQLKAEGVKSGVPDVLLLCARGPWHGLAIEMKVPAYPADGKMAGVVSTEQNQWLEALHAEGYCCHVCWGWEQAKDAILAYLNA